MKEASDHTVVELRLALLNAYPETLEGQWLIFGTGGRE
jgi:hypothetical protein